MDHFSAKPTPLWTSCFSPGCRFKHPPIESIRLPSGGASLSKGENLPFQPGRSRDNNPHSPEEGAAGPQGCNCRSARGSPSASPRRKERVYLRSRVCFSPRMGRLSNLPETAPGGAVFPPHDPSRIVSPSSAFLCANPHPKRRRSNRYVFRFERELFPIDREVVPVRPSFQPGRDGGRASLPILRSHQIDRIAHTFASSFGAHPTATKDIRSLWKVPKRSR